jgi:hypothetical protein
MSHNRTDRHFSFVRVAEAHATDDLQAVLIADVEEQFNRLWPGSLRAPDALYNLYESVAQLLEYTSKGPRGRAAIRKRVLAVTSHHTEAPAFGPNDLATNEHARVVVPGLVASILREAAAELNTSMRPEDSTAIADEVEAWLAVED